MNKKAISPLIATVLLIVFALVIAGIILSWGRGQVTEITEAAGEQVDIELACSTILAKVAVTTGAPDTVLVTNANNEVIGITGTYANAACTANPAIAAGATVSISCVGASEPGAYSLFVSTDTYNCGPLTGTA